MKKLHTQIYILLALFVSLTSCYYTTQAYYLFKYTYDDAQNVEALLADPKTPQDTKAFLQNVKTIKAFLLGYAHLNIKKTYNSYTALEQDYLLSVVQAAPEFELTPYVWGYPFVGKLPYRGYYKEEDAKKEAQKLRKQNYDVLIRRVRAFSTLNALPDPLYSFMKQYEEWELAQLIAHEQTHATIWVAGQSGFNEQLANFVGRQSALDYIQTKYGAGSEEHKKMLKREKNARAFSTFLRQVRTQLKNAYQNAGSSKDEKRRKKKFLLQKAQEDFVKNYQKRFTDDSYASVDITKYNNAFFATISLYEENNAMFEKAYEACGKSMSKFIDTLEKVEKPPHKKAPFAFLQSMCEQ